MASLNSIQSEHAALFSGIGDNEATIISGSSPEDIKFSNTELRRRLGIPEDESMANYKNLHAIGLGGIGAVFAGSAGYISASMPKYFAKQRLRAGLDARST